MRKIFKRAFLGFIICCWPLSCQNNQVDEQTHEELPSLAAKAKAKPQPKRYVASSESMSLQNPEKEFIIHDKKLTKGKELHVSPREDFLLADE